MSTVRIGDAPPSSTLIGVRANDNNNTGKLVNFSYQLCFKISCTIQSTFLTEENKDYHLQNSF